MLSSFMIRPNTANTVSCKIKYKFKFKQQIMALFKKLETMKGKDVCHRVHKKVSSNNN